MAAPEEHIQATIALQVSRLQGEPVGSYPTEEELAALHDGMLDETRRAQVISHLAHEPDLYRQWYALRESAALFEVAAPVPVSAPPVEKPAFLTRVRSWLARPAMATVVVAALLTVVVPGLRPDYSRDIDKLYQQPLPDPPGDWLQPAPGAMRSLSAVSTKSTTRVLLEQGLVSGLNELSQTLELPGLPRSQLSQPGAVSTVSLLMPDRRARYDLGRLTAIAMIQCRVGLANSDFDSTRRQFMAIKDRLVAADSISDQAALLQALSPVTPDADPQYATCAASQRIVNWLAHD